MSCAVGCGGDGSTSGTADTDRYAWTQLTPSGVSARVVTTDAACPDAMVDGAVMAMDPRASTSPSGFDVRVCELAVPEGAQTLVVGEQSLRLPPSDTPTKVVIVGDTGCRIKQTDTTVIAQACNDNSDQGWPFSRVASAIAAENPELIFHMGDYHYREAPCPDGNEGCEGSPYGPNWASWHADWFEPGEQLLPVAPWVFTRGNHEDCGRAWLGWFLFMDASPLPTDPWNQDNCQQFTPPYRVAVGDLSVAVMDSSSIPKSANPPTPDPDAVAEYAAQLTAIAALLADDSNAWLTTHRPFWSPRANLPGDGDPLVAIETTLIAAIEATGGLPPQVPLAIAGHVHQFQKMTFDDGRPMQLAIGGGGTQLAPPVTSDAIATYPEVFGTLGLDPMNFDMFDEFGFVVATRVGDAWTASLRDLDGGEITSFPLPAAP